MGHQMLTVTGEAHLSVKPLLQDGVSSFLGTGKVSSKPNCGELSYFILGFLLPSFYKYILENIGVDSWKMCIGQGMEEEA